MGFVTPLTVNTISALALNVPAVSVTVITVPLNTAALALAPAGDENATPQPLHASPEPLSVTTNLPVLGTAVAGCSVTVISTPVAPLITDDSAIVGALVPIEPSTIAGSVLLVALL